MISDTEEAAESIWLSLLRRQTPTQRLNKTVELSNAVRSMFLANLQHLDEPTRRRRLAEACYGKEAAERLFGK